MPSFRTTPISEFNRSQALLSWAFPTLFPRGDAEFVTPRLRDIPYPMFAKHSLLYKDGRFAQHPRFRYVVFNTIMRKQVNTCSGFFVRKTGAVDYTLEDLRRAFNDDSVEAQSIINSITRFAGSLR